MEFQDVLRKRRMIRSFDDRPLPAEVVDRIVRNAQRAPSAGYSQGFEFLVLEAAPDRAAFWKATDSGDPRAARYRFPKMLHAPLLVVCLSDKQRYLERYAEPDKGWTDRDESRWPVPYWDIDTGFAALLMLLTAVDAGLGAVFFGIFPAFIPRFRSEFSVPERLMPIGVVAVGYPSADERPAGSARTRRRRSGAEVIHRGRYGAGT